MLLDTTLAQVVANPQAPPALRREVQVAQIALNAKFIRFNEATLREVRAAFPSADLSRLKRGLGSLVGDSARPDDEPRRAPQLYFPDMPPIPWFDWVEFLAHHRQAALLLTGEEPPLDPRLAEAHSLALAAIR